MVKCIQLFFILISFFYFSCAHKLAPEPRPKTVTSDLFPEKISRSEYYRELAVGFARDEQTDKAIELFRLSLLHDPANITAKIQLADAFRKVKMEYLAITQLSEVLQMDSANILALQKMGDLYLTTHIYSKARAAYLELLNLNPADDKAMWALYFINKLEKKYDEAFADLDKIEAYITTLSSQEQERQNQSETLFHIANEKASLYRLQKNWLQEQKYLISAYQVKPNFLSHVLLLSDSYFRFNNWTDAAVILQRFTDTNDFNYEISEKLAFASVQLENYDVVLREYAKQRPFCYDRYAIDLKSAHIYFLMKDLKSAEEKYLALLKERNNSEASYYLSKVYQLTDRDQDSAVLLENIPTFSNYFGEAQVELADYEKKNNGFDLAINRLRKAQAKRPDLALLYKSYSDLLIENNRFVESVALLEQGIGFYPNDEELRLRLAFIHYRLNNQKSFKKQIAKAISINPNNSQIYAGLAELWYMKNKKSSDVEFFVRQAMQLKSQNKNLKPLLAWAMMDQNRSTEAIAVFEEYYEQNPNEYYYIKSLANIYRLGHVTTKAKSFLKVAQNLEAETSLKERLLDKIQKKSLRLDETDLSNSRLPASLENY